jgi:hypothetical protein
LILGDKQSSKIQQRILGDFYSSGTEGSASFATNLRLLRQEETFEQKPANYLKVFL